MNCQDLYFSTKYSNINWLLRELTKEGLSLSPFQGVTYAIFGLGNKQYEHFCAVGKRVYDAMNTLGATAVVERGEGDDDEDIDADFDSWKEKLLAALDSNSALCKTAAPRKAGFSQPFSEHWFQKDDRSIHSP